jgi:hypothetical protein
MNHGDHGASMNIADANGFCGQEEESTGLTGFFRIYRMRDLHDIL